MDFIPEWVQQLDNLASAQVTGSRRCTVPIGDLYKPAGRGKESPVMDLHELIRVSQEYITAAELAEQRDDLGSAYDHIDGLYDLLTTELVPMERPE